MATEVSILDAEQNTLGVFPIIGSSRVEVTRIEEWLCTDVYHKDCCNYFRFGIIY